MKEEETNEVIAERSYAEYRDAERLSFDPMKDLNLPASYEEVVLRYKRLRSGRTEPGPCLN
ncbi:MAG TPA: hypothetical protein PKD45_11290 [Flavobacteriales bacterium]|nr:hypothetical protein [Flavobacteriales bacterium]